MGNVNFYLDIIYDEDYNDLELNILEFSDDDYDDLVLLYVVNLFDDLNINKNFIEVDKIGFGNFGLVFRVVCK